MTGSLSVLLPTFENQPALVRTLSHLLEVLPELTSRFEVLIIDDGSADDTGLIAREFAGSYPQIKVAEHAKRLGRSACMRTGLARSKQDLLLYWDEACALDAHGLHKLWKQIPDHDIVMGYSAEDFRLRAGSGLQMLSRAVAEASGWAVLSQQEWMLRIQKRGYRLLELELREAADVHMSHSRWRSDAPSGTVAGFAVPRRRKPLERLGRLVYGRQEA